MDRRRPLTPATGSGGSPGTRRGDGGRPSGDDGAARHHGLRPGPSGNESAPNHANYDEAKANPYPEPARGADARRTDRKVTTAEMWWKQRRPEIVEDFEREVSAAIPRGVPKVTWTVDRRPTERSLAIAPVVGKQLVGHVDNSAYPGDHRRHPDDAGDAGRREGPVPVMMMFGGGALAAGASARPVHRRAGGGRRRRRRRSAGDPPATEQLIAAGWGYASLSPTSIQADNGAGLTEGHHRPGQQGPAAQARRLGLAARLGVGRVARARLPRDRQGRRRQARRHRRRVALRQGGARHDGVRPAVRGGAGRLVRRGRRQAAPPQLRRGRREPHRLRRVPLDGRQLPQVRRRRGDLRQQERRATFRWTRTS